MTLYFQSFAGEAAWAMSFLCGVGNVGAESVQLHGDPVWKVTSVSGTAAAGVARLQQMMAASEDVVVLFVPSSYVVPGNPPVEISSVGGGAVATAPFTPPMYAALVDGGNCYGKGYYIYANNWQTIENYQHIILGHELAHISHYIMGVPTSEALATMGENLHRSELGLPLRSVTKHAGGCNPPPPSIWDWIVQVLGEVRQLSPLRPALRAPAPGCEVSRPLPEDFLRLESSNG